MLFLRFAICHRPSAKQPRKRLQPRRALRAPKATPKAAESLDVKLRKEMWEMAEMEAGGMAGHGMARAHFAIQAHGELITGYHVE